MNPAYLQDASGFQGHAEAAYTPADEHELSELLRTASSHATPLTIAGAGTGVTGARVPSGGWVLSLERFRRLEIGTGEAIAGAGVSLKDLQQTAQRSGQFYAPDPTEMSASVGGTIATNASGSRSFRFGDTRRHVKRLRIAFADGSIRDILRGEKPRFSFREIPLPNTTKHATGYVLRHGMDLVDMFVGSEGTLGIITEATVSLLAVPEELLTGVVFFEEDSRAIRAVETWRSIAGLQMLEYLDAGSIGLLRDRYPEIRAESKAALLIEQELASDSDLDRWEQRLIDADAQIEDSWFGTGEGDRERFRRFRHAIPEAVNDLVRRRGLQKMGTDFAVPLARNAEMMAYYRERLDAEFPDSYVIFGHIGDAHVHVNILPKSSDESARAAELIREMAGHAVALGGTISAEHGLGKRKAHFLQLQYRREDIEAMWEVKHHFDPQGLLGRGTLFV